MTPSTLVQDASDALAPAMLRASFEIFQSMPDAAFIIDSSDAGGRIQQVNRQACLMFGYASAELIGRSIDTLVPEGARVRHSQHRLDYAAAPHRRPMGTGLELIGRRRDGSEFPLEVLLDANLDDASITIAVVRDLSARTQMRHALQASEARLREISERADAVEAARASEARLRSIFSSLADGVTVQTNTGAIVDANVAAEAILGLSRDQLLGRASLDPEWQAVHADGTPFPGEDHPAMVTLRTGQPIRNQVMGVLVPDQGLRWININSQPIANDGGLSSVAVVTTFTDITTTRALETQVATESARNRVYLRAVSDGLHIQDSEGRLVEVSDSFCKMLGYERSELIGQYPSVWDAHLTGEALDAAIARLFAGTLKRFETIHRRKDGSVFPVEVHVERFELNGRRHLCCSSRDMTERTNAEAARRASETKNRVLFDAAVYASALLSSPGHVILEVNDAWVNLLGYSREEAIGKTSHELGITRDDAARRAANRQLDTVGALDEHEWNFTSKSGAVITCRVNAARITIEGEGYSLITARDVTEQRSLERAVLESATAEQQKLGRDLHDGLGQELTGISMMASALAISLRKSGFEIAHNGEVIADLLRKAVRHCRAIAHGLSPLSYAGGDLRRALEEAVILQRDSFKVDARLECRQTAPLALDTDALDNLYCIAQEAITNARRHGSCRTLIVRLEVGPQAVRLAVEDDGVGLRANPPSATGMGLRVMAFRAEAIGAQLSMEPREGGGTVVTVERAQKRR